MGKHTLRNLGEEKTIKHKKAKIKKSLIKPRLLILTAILILIVSAITANIILFAENYYYIDGCQLGYATDCSQSSKTIFIYVALMILPIAFAVYATVRTLAKHQNILSVISIILIIVAIFSPFIVINTYNQRISSYKDTTLLSIKTPQPENNCNLIGLNNNDDSTCRVQAGTAPYQVKKIHNNTIIPLKIGDDQIIIHLDTKLNIFNADRQNLHVCTYFNGDPQANCQELIYSNNTASTYEDDSYSYEYFKNQLSITKKVSPSSD